MTLDAELIQGSPEWHAAEVKRVYWVWADMLSRCRNSKHRSFANYGGRGIGVCSRWEGFKDFFGDMGPRPLGATLDRIDNDKGYEPGNCRWASRKEQNSNRRNCVYVADVDEHVTVKEFCRRRSLPYRPIMKRIQDRGWPIEQALTVPVGSVHRRPQ
jgi:hypothetical protein